MNGTLNGNYCWCCERPMLPALSARPKGHSGVVEKDQIGPRYCVGCIRTGRKIAKRGLR